MDKKMDGIDDATLTPKVFPLIPLIFGSIEFVLMMRSILTFHLSGGLLGIFIIPIGICVANTFVIMYFQKVRPDFRTYRYVILFNLFTFLSFFLCFALTALTCSSDIGIYEDYAFVYITAFAGLGLNAGWTEWVNREKKLRLLNALKQFKGESLSSSSSKKNLKVIQNIIVVLIVVVSLINAQHVVKEEIYQFVGFIGALIALPGLLIICISSWHQLFFTNKSSSDVREIINFE